MPVPTQAPPAVGFDDVTYGIGAVVEVEERRLGALQQQMVVGVERVVQQLHGVGDVGRQPTTERREPSRRSRRRRAARRPARRSPRCG